MTAGARGQGDTGTWGGKDTVQRCKCGVAACKGAKVGDRLRVAGGSPGWQVAGGMR